jgi:hypothetical protein
MQCWLATPRAVLLVILMLVTGSAVAQNEDVLDLGLEVQIYPTGVISGLNIGKGFSGRHAIHFRLGSQRIRHEDFGVHDDERGDGYGFTLGYRYYLQPGFRGMSLGFRTDVWFNQLNWRDNMDQPNELGGHTDVIVLQPTVQAGYSLVLDKRLHIRPAVAIGYEINVSTDGEDVGEGVIGLIGLEFGRRFR